MAKYVVTGGAGFIGSWVQDLLVERGHEVHVVDTLVRGERQRENLNEKALFHRTDVQDYPRLLDVFVGADGVFHLAALPRMQYSIEHPRPTFMTNELGTLNVLEAASRAGVRRVVYSASSSAYGTLNKPPFTEDMPVSNLVIPYAAQKYAGEMHCRSYAWCEKVETVCLRYFNVYGPGQTTDADGPYATVIGIFLGQREKGLPMTVVPPGTQRRDFTYVGDVADANLKAMLSAKVGGGEVINIGTGENRSILEVAGLIGGATTFIAERRGEATETLADISKARKFLGWQPTTGFDEGILICKQKHGLA